MLVLVSLATASVSGRDGRWLMKVSTSGRPSSQGFKLRTSRTSAIFWRKPPQLPIFLYVLIMTQLYKFRRASSTSPNTIDIDRPSDDLVQHPSSFHQSCLINLGVEVRPTAAHYCILIHYVVSSRTVS